MSLQDGRPWAEQVTSGALALDLPPAGYCSFRVAQPKGRMFRHFSGFIMLLFQLKPVSAKPCICFLCTSEKWFYPILYLHSQALTPSTDSSLSPLSAMVGLQPTAPACPDLLGVWVLLLAIWMVPFCSGASDPTVHTVTSGRDGMTLTWLCPFPLASVLRIFALPLLNVC